MQDLIADFPDDFECFHGKGFVLIKREGTLPGFGRFDLLFEDRQHNKILMELKAGRTQVDEVMNQVDRYCAALENLGVTNILMYVVATEIPRPHRRMLNNAEIECCEISEAEFRRVARKHNYSWLAEEPSPGTSPGRPIRHQATTSPFVVPKPYPDAFQWVYVPLVRNEFSMKELIDLFLNGVDNRSKDDKVLNMLFGAGILNRSEEENILKEMFQAGIFENRPDPAWIRGLVIKWLKTGLEAGPTLKSERFFSWFAYVKYPIGGGIADIDNKNIEDIADIEPIRIICRPRWFDENGGNSAMKYLGGRVKRRGREGQEEFYGKDGSGGRFPLRRDTPIPGNVG